MFYYDTFIIRRCDCVKCLGAVTQSHRTRQRHMQLYGCRELLPRPIPDNSQHARIEAPSSPPPDSPCENDETMSNHPSISEQQDPDYDPMAQQHSENNPTDSESHDDDDDEMLEDLDSSNDERPIYDHNESSLSDGSRNDDCIDEKAHQIFQGECAVQFLIHIPI